MALEKTNAIVLRVVEFSETSCIVTLMTRDHGKVTAIAKGARRPKSSFEAALDLLAICRIVFLHKSSSAMDVLTEAKLERRFRCSTRCLHRLYAGYYLAELLTLLTDDADPHPDLYDLAVETIEAIDNGEFGEKAAESIDQTVMDFELNALRSLGHLPMLTQCVSCGREKQTLNSVSFGINAGGILCRSCRPGERNVVSLSSGGLEFLLQQTNQLQTMNDRDSSSVNWSAGSQVVREHRLEDYQANSVEILADRTDERFHESSAEVRKLLRNYITHLVGYPPRLQKFLSTQ